MTATLALLFSSNGRFSHAAPCHHVSSLAASATPAHPTPTMWWLFAITLLLGFAAWFMQSRAGALEARAEDITPVFRIGCTTAERDLAEANARSDRARLIEKAAAIKSAANAGLFFALVSGLTISFEAIWYVGVGAAAIAIAIAFVTWLKLPQIDRRIDVYHEYERWRSSNFGYLFSSESKRGLRHVIRATAEDLGDFEEWFAEQRRLLEDQVDRMRQPHRPKHAPSADQTPPQEPPSPDLK
jgi:hypothetical protein